ncbi:MAG TPA: tetratricopeptide repeat protein [Vicinamibacterales bacterium]|nr:tetratricopeptide repeat protein [Vicinamibacterales bacterium]
MSSGRLALGAVLAAALATKLIVLAQLGGHPLLQPHGDLDPAYYVDLARKISTAGPLAPREPFFVSPLYIYFLAAIFSAGGSLTAARVVQVLLGTAAVGLVYASARRWFGSRVAVVAAVLALACGIFTFSEIVVLQSALDPFLVAAALYCMARAVTAPGRGALVCGGVALGLLALNRPNALAYGIVAIVLLGFTSIRRAILLAGALGAVLALNATGNYLASGEAVVISSHGGLNFYIGNNADADGTYRPVPGIAPSIAGQARDAARVAEAAEGRALSASQVSSYFYSAAWLWIRTHPGDAMRLFARKLALACNRVEVPLNYSYAFYSRDEATLLRWLVVGSWLLLPLGLVGLGLAATNASDRLAYWTWAGYIPVYAISVAAFFVSDRYRMPLLVPLAIFAAYTVVWLSDRFRARKLAAVATAAAAMAAAAALSWVDLGVDDGVGGERARKTVSLVDRGSYEEARAYAGGADAGLRYPGVFHYRVGEAFTRAGRYADAIAELRKALTFDSNEPAVHLALGQALLISGATGEALPYLAQAFERAFRPEVSGPWLVRALDAADRSAEAVDVLRALPDPIIDAIRPETRTEMASIAERLGVALVLERRPADALNPLVRASRLDPASASIRLNLAVAYAQLGRAEEAAAAAREAARLDPSEPRAAALLEALHAPR